MMIQHRNRTVWYKVPNTAKGRVYSWRYVVVTPSDEWDIRTRYQTGYGYSTVSALCMDRYERQAAKVVSINRFANRLVGN